MLDWVPPSSANPELSRYANNLPLDALVQTISQTPQESRIRCISIMYWILGIHPDKICAAWEKV